MFVKLSPTRRCAFCREMGTASATGRDTDDRNLAIAAGGSSITGPSTPALSNGASAAIALARGTNCRCDVSNVG